MLLKLVFGLVIFNHSFGVQSHSKRCQNLFDHFEDEQRSEISENLQELAEWNTNGQIPDSFVEIAVTKSLFDSKRENSTVVMMKLMGLSKLVVDQYFYENSVSPETFTPVIATETPWYKKILDKLFNRNSTSQTIVEVEAETFNEADVDNIVLVWKYWMDTTNEVCRKEKSLDLRGEFLDNVVKNILIGIDILSESYPSQKPLLQALQSEALDHVIAYNKMKYSNPVVILESQNILNLVTAGTLEFDVTKVNSIVDILVKNIGDHESNLLYSLQNFINENSKILTNSKRKLNLVQAKLNVE